MLIDSHCHLDSPDFDPDRDAVLQRAHDAGVEYLLAIGTGAGPPGLEAALRLADAHPAFLATVGVHPHDAAKATPETYKHLDALRAHHKVVAIGEIGLDYYYDFSPRDTQKAVFIEQMAIAASARLPIVIHTREAWDDTFSLLETHWKPHGLPGIMHCFSGGPSEAQRSLDLGFCLAFGGVVTYPKSVAVQEAAKMVPADRLLVETDAPYLAPVPKRGKRNEPAFVVHTAAKLAALRGVSLEDIESITTANFWRIAQREPGPSGRVR